jgi:putative ATP-dependent endonuclease of OLD family
MGTAAAADEPNLRIAEIRIQDFRTIQDLWMPVRSSLVLLGENNSGKTAFLSALDVALGTGRAREEDLRRDVAGKIAPKLVIDIRFEPRVGDDFDDSTAQVLGTGPIQLSDKPFFSLRTKGALDPRRGDLVVKRTFVKGWARDRVGAEKLSEVASVHVTREHRDLVAFNLLDARRDALEQLKNRRTFWGQLVSDLQLDSTIRAEVEHTLAEVGSKLKAGSPPLGTLQTDLQDIRKVIGHPQLDVVVSPLPVGVEDLLRVMDLLLTETGQLPLPMALQGMGTRSLSALLIFRAYVRAILTKTTGAGTLSVAAFEEPEAHLHPHAQRSVLSVIQAIPGQRIVSTHSPFIAAIADVKDIRVFRRGNGGTTVSWLRETDATGASAFTAEQLSHLRRFVQQRHGEILFAKVVGLFEGDTEDAAIPVFARAHWPDGPDSLGISMVNVGGAGNYKHIVTALHALSIPWVVFSDGDPAATVGLSAAGKAIGQTLDHAAAEIVLLPNGRDFEAYLIAEGFRHQMEQGIGRFFGQTAMEEFKSRNDGTKLSGNKGVRDYHSPGWEERLVHDFVDKHKGTYGAAVAEDIVAAGKVPGQLREFFDRIDKILGRPVKT